MSDELKPDDLREDERVRIEWSPGTNAQGGRGDSVEGTLTRVWRRDGEVQEFTVDAGDDLLNVYTDYRNPVVERVTDPDAEDPDTETVGRLDDVSYPGE